MAGELGIINIPNNYVSDWSQGHGREWCEISPYDANNTAIYNPTPPTGVFVNDEWVARYSAVAGYGRISTIPRFVLSTRKDFTVVVPITINASPKAGRSYYQAVALYNGESSYFGLYFKATPEGTTIYCHNCGYGGFELENASPYLLLTELDNWWSVGEKVYVKIECDTVNDETRLYISKNGTIWTLAKTRYHTTIEGSYFGWLEPVSLWITGYNLNSINVNSPWNIDLHPISIARDATTKILAGAGAHYPWSKYWNPLPSGFNSWDLPYVNGGYGGCILVEGQEALPEPEGMVSSWLEEEAYHAVVYEGDNTYYSPIISCGEDTFRKIRLYGRSTATPDLGSFLEVKVLDTALQPITIGGQQTFTPDSGPFTPLEIDISEIAQNEIILSFRLNQIEQYQFDHTAGFNWQDITPILFGFVVEGQLRKSMAVLDGGTITISAWDEATATYYGFDEDPETEYTESLSVPEGAKILYYYSEEAGFIEETRHLLIAGSADRLDNLLVATDRLGNPLTGSPRGSQ